MFGARAGPGQNLIHGERLLFSLCLVVDEFSAAIALDTGDLRIEAQRYPLTNESFLHERGCLHVLTIEQVRIFVEQADLGTQPLKGLRQLATNRSATDDRKPGRTLSKIEDGFVGQVAGLSQSRDRRFRGTRAGRDDRPFEPQGLSCRPRPYPDRQSWPHPGTHPRQALQSAALNHEG